jgi:hypothetical protein
MVPCKKSRLKFGLQRALTNYSSVGEQWTRRSLKSSLATYGCKRIFGRCLLLMLPLCGWSQSYLRALQGRHTLSKSFDSNVTLRSDHAQSFPERFETSGVEN